MHNYIAHIDDAGNIQTVKEHSENTAKLSRNFSISEFSDICYTAGLFHDIGKYQESFQKRIRGENIQVEHSKCGAQEIRNIYDKKRITTHLLSLCIIGHHTGIPDCGNIDDTEDMSTLFGRLKRTSEDYSDYVKDITAPKLDLSAVDDLLKKNCSSRNEKLDCYAHIVRYCYSCLIDADTIDTKRSVKEIIPKSLTADFDKCLDLINNRLSSCKHVTRLQQARETIQKQIFSNIDKDSEIYLIDMPTGSGKTYASMKYALMKCLKDGMKRIIYVIPYNTIIDQTCADFEKLFGENAQILRHQSTFSYENKDDLDEDFKASAIYSCENWDAKIIITTAVQFYESICSSKRGKLRKIHNIADSMIIFDEAHMMPTKYLQPCLMAVSFITKFLHSKAILMTATMPDFRECINKYALSSSTVTDLVPDKGDYKYFKKNKYINIGTISDEMLIQKARQYASSLIVVNSKKRAKELYNHCSGVKYHLSTYMTGKQRDKTIQAIRNAINKLSKYKNADDVPINERITVISTSLIEAGVDLDFRAAFREISGLDDILQTGGRCNREGLYKTGNVYIFESERSSAKQTIEQNIMKGLFSEYPDISSDEAVKAYYSRLFQAKREDIISHILSNSCSTPDTINFKSYQVNLIESSTESILIPQDETIKDIINKGRAINYINPRKIQEYTCSVSKKELDELQKQNVLEEIGGIYVLRNMDYFDVNTGIQTQGKDIWC